MNVTGIAGGIGCGKSVVSNMLRAMGYGVYDSDARARAIMDSSKEIKDFLVREIHAASVDSEGCIDRVLVGNVVFADEGLRQKLNKAVHEAVKNDFMQWLHSEAPGERAFVECAILCESGLVELVDDVWEVAAPLDVRVRRVCLRNNLNERQVLSRIESQEPEAMALAAIPHVLLQNDGLAPLLPQVEALLDIH